MELPVGEFRAEARDLVFEGAEEVAAGGDRADGEEPVEFIVGEHGGGDLVPRREAVREVFDVAGLATGSTPPPAMDNFKGLTLSAGSVVVPEPTTIALAALGLGGLLFISRRK